MPLKLLFSLYYRKNRCAKGHRTATFASEYVADRKPRKQPESHLKAT